MLRITAITARTLKPTTTMKFNILKPVSLVAFAAYSVLYRNEQKIGFIQSNSLKRFWNRLFSTSDWSLTNADDVADYVKDGKIKKIVVMVGAGISTPSGIPDFRSPGTGLYDNLQKYNLPYPEAVFDIDYFNIEPKPFFSLAQELYPSGQYKPNAVHQFIQLLNNKGFLHRLYTQNIDGLERLAGIPADKMVEAHGTFHTATCRVCYKSYEGKEIQDDIFKGIIPRCRRKLCNGVIKPDIVFFGEQLPSRFYLFMADMPQADLLLVMGTSLEVQPFAGISEATLPGVPRLLINREVAGPFLYNPRKNDIVLEGDLVEKVWEFANMLGWDNELKDLINNYDKSL